MQSPLPKWFILIFAPPGNGKSLEQARLSEKVLKEYRHIEKKYPKLAHRILFTNQILNEEYICKRNKFTLDWFKEHVKYWEQPEEFRYCLRRNCFIKSNGPHVNHDFDLFCDEGATLFPATAKGAADDMPLWLKKFISQHRHNGVRILLLTQDFMGVNIAARRCLWASWYMKKIIGSRDPSPTLPPVKWIWGLYSKRPIDPDLMKKDFTDVMITIKKMDDSQAELMDELRLIGFPEYHLITRHKCTLYDTRQNVKEIELKREIEHIEVACRHPLCAYVHKTHKLK